MDRNKYPSLQRNAAAPKEKDRLIPRPVVATVQINGQPARALLDSGSLGDFISTTLADQLKLKRIVLDKPITLQLAVQGSRSKVNSRVEARLQYQSIDETRQFDVININSYDLILGTPWMWQHQVCIGLNPARVVIGSDTTLPMKLGANTKPMAHSVAFDSDEVEAAREEL